MFLSSSLTYGTPIILDKKVTQKEFNKLMLKLFYENMQKNPALIKRNVIYDDREPERFEQMSASEQISVSVSKDGKKLPNEASEIIPKAEMLKDDQNDDLITKNQGDPLDNYLKDNLSGSASEVKLYLIKPPRDIPCLLCLHKSRIVPSLVYNTK